MWSTMKTQTDSKGSEVVGFSFGSFLAFSSSFLPLVRLRVAVSSWFHLEQVCELKIKDLMLVLL